MINFKTVKWRNFLSTGNTPTEIQLDKNPSTLIIGENGAGKSTILDALCFGLFGKPFRNISKNQLVNTINNGSVEVEVTFSVGSKNYRIFRGIKPNKFEIYLDKVMLNQEANVRDYQKILEQQILKLNYRSFTQVVILGSSTFVPFMQLKARHRREVVEEILDIQIFSIMNMIMKQKLRTNTDEKKEIEYNLDLTSEKVKLKKQYIDDIKNNRQKITDEKQLLLANNEKVIIKRTSAVSILKEKNEDLLTSIVDRESVNTNIVKLKDLQSTLKEKHKTHSRTVGFFEKNEDCPVCKQHIDEAFKDGMMTSENSKVEEMSNAITELTNHLSTKEKRKSEITNIIEEVRRNEVEYSSIAHSAKELEKFNVSLEIEIKNLLSHNINQSDTAILNGLVETLAKLKNQATTLREDQAYYEACRSMLQDTGIKTKIIKQYLPVMNKLINTYLTSMEFYVNFTLNEEFIETIKSRYRDDFSYESFSEGEKMRIDLALLFTWRAIAKMKNSTNTNLLILDEIFDSSLDGTGTDEFLKILNTLGGENVFVISHKQDALADKFKSTIKFEKIKNFSHVVET